MAVTGAPEGFDTSGQESRDAGFTMTELLTSMFIFAVIISIFLAGMVSMTSSTVRAQDVSDAGDSVRLAFQTLDKQIRYADSINSPGVGSSGAHYVEFLTSAQEDGLLPLCTQWRYDPTAATLSYRTWRDAPTGTVSEWRMVADDMRNDLSGATPDKPFVLLFAASAQLRQELVVSLSSGRTGEIGTGADIGTRFVARNSSVQSLSNHDTNGDGISDVFVCSSHLARP